MNIEHPSDFLSRLVTHLNGKLEIGKPKGSKILQMKSSYLYSIKKKKKGKKRQELCRKTERKGTMEFMLFSLDA